MYEVISVEFYRSVTLCVSPCSFHSVFPYHLLRWAAATSQHICHVPLWAAGHPCVWGQWWVTCRYAVSLQGWLWPLQKETTLSLKHTVMTYMLWYDRLDKRPECWFAFSLAQCVLGWVVLLLTSLCPLQPPQVSCPRCTASCAASSLLLCFMASATEHWRWEQRQQRCRCHGTTILQSALTEILSNCA